MDNFKDFQSMMSNIMKNSGKFKDSMQSMMDNMSSPQSNVEIEGRAGGDMVIARVNLKQQITHLEFKPELATEDNEVACELIMAAINSALHKSQNELKDNMLKMAQNLGKNSSAPITEGV